MSAVNKEGVSSELEELYSELPLCVDLDGTLLKIDSLQEAAFASVMTDARVLGQMPLWLARGKATLKQECAKRWAFDPAHLPYNEKLLDHLRRMRARGRRIVLVTAADHAIADPIAKHLGLFDEVIASDGIDNLRGAAKADALCRQFGAKGFVYAGNDSTDHAVWQQAAAAVLVNCPLSVRRAAEQRYSVAAVIEDRPIGVTRAAVKAMRPYQWVKNILIFVPLLTSGDFTDWSGWLSASLIFAAFCAVASSIYLLNDISDLAADRMHPRNRRRPFASGALPISVGLALMPVLLGIGLALGWGTSALPPLLAYCVLSLSYNLKLKEMPLIDVFVLAALYTVRLFAGGEATAHPVSLWLLGFSSFLFLSLALVKRVSELHRLRLEKREAAARRGYMTSDLDILQIMGCAAAFASVVVLSLYIQSDTASLAYARPTVLWGIIPLMLFWQCRLWLSTARGYMHDDPIVYAARDWVSWLVFVSLAGLVALAYLPETAFGL